jgi:hypothetical protein
MNTKQMADTDAILAMKAENDRLREDSEMLDWLIANQDKFALDHYKKADKWFVETVADLTPITEGHDTPRAAIREAMEMDP